MHKNVKDITGQRFGRLTVVGRDTSAYQGVATWFCSCDCGCKLSVSGASLRQGNTKSCGCIRRNTTYKPRKVLIEMIDRRFGKLIVVEKAKNGNSGEQRWKCLCDCGATTVARGTSLRSGKTKSCGCLIIEKTIERLTKHGKIVSSEYHAWKNMKRRCYAPGSTNYKNWGGRGIKVCERWLESFENFYADMGDKPSPEYSLDRIDNNLGYSKENCRWATGGEQQKNKRPYQRKEKTESVNHSNNA